MKRTYKCARKQIANGWEEEYKKDWDSPPSQPD
jgi:hypothetical protein